MMQKRTKFLLTVLLIALAARLLALAAAFIPVSGGYSPEFYLFDSYKYLDAAAGILQQSAFTRTTTPEIFLTPGYSVLLVLGLAFGAVLTGTLIAQCIVSVLTVYFVFCIAEELFPSHQEVALYSGILYAIEPLSILYTWQLVPDTLFTLFVCAGIYFFIAYVKTASIPRFILSALLLAASVYVKVSSYYLAPAIALGYGGWLLWKRKLNATILRQLIIFLSIVFILIGAWQVRNQRETGFAGFSTITAYNLYYFEAVPLLAKHANIPVYAMQSQLSDSFSEINDQVVYYKKLFQSGMQVLFEHPFEYMYMYARGFLIALFEPGAVDFCKFLGRYPAEGGLLGLMSDKGIVPGLMQLWKGFPAIFAISVLFETMLVAYLLLAVRALLRIRWNAEAAVFAFLLCAGYLFLSMRGGVAGYSKYRHAFMPVLCILSGAGLGVVMRPARKA